jgi:hypothetical protein
MPFLNVYKQLRALFSGFSVLLLQQVGVALLACFVGVDFLVAMTIFAFLSLNTVS